MSSNANIQELLEKIKLRINAYIDQMNVSSLVKRGMKSFANSQVDRLPGMISASRAQSFVAGLLKNPVIRKNAELQKQMGAAYWAVKTASQPTAAKREASVKKLISGSCPTMTPQKKNAILALIGDKCADYSCSAQTYWEVFTHVDTACWIALLDEK